MEGSERGVVGYRGRGKEGGLGCSEGVIWLAEARVGI